MSLAFLCMYSQIVLNKVTVFALLNVRYHKIALFILHHIIHCMIFIFKSFELIAYNIMHYKHMIEFLKIIMNYPRKLSSINYEESVAVSIDNCSWLI